MRWLAILSCLSCYSPSIGDGQFTCMSSSTCPDGFECICQVCRKSGTTISCTSNDMSVGDLAMSSDDLSSASTDLSVLHDLATAPDLKPPPDMATLPGCASRRSQADPGKANVALCDAAWTYPGINPSPNPTPCNHVVTSDGTNGSGTQCTTEDNCAVGWHVCLDQTELTTKGWTGGDCTNLATSNALWLTRQPGAPPMPGPGPPECTGTMSITVFGCGQFGNAPAASCTLLNKALVNPPDAVDDCKTATQNTFVCGTAMAPEATTVYKPTMANGGVICCHN
jgi:hypothetical protein